MKILLLSLLCLTLTGSLRAEDSPAKAPETAPAAAAPATTAPEFTGKALEVKKKLEVLFDFSKDVNNADAKKRSAARAAIDSALDWDKISEDAIGAGEWKKLSAANRSSFRDLLKDVIVRTAYTRLDKFWEGGTTSAFQKIEMDPSNKAHVVAVFTVKNEPFSLDYYVHSKAGKWLVYDIAFEGERYSVNINEQIAAFLNEKSFTVLMEKLRKRRTELMAEAEKPKKKG